MKLNEFNLYGRDDSVNDYGTSTAKHLGNVIKNKVTGKGPTDFNPRDARARDIFTQKFVEKASAGLEKAVQSGAVDPNATAAPVAQPAQPAAKTPEQIRKEKQAAAVKAIDNPAKPAPAAPAGTAMPTKPYQVPGAGTNPNPKQAKPAQPKQKELKATAGPNPDDYANLEKRIQAAKATQKESKYAKMNAIFESILSEASPTISSFITDAFTAYAGQVTDPTMQQQLQTLANEVQATYAKDKGVAAMKKLGNLAYSVATGPAQAAPTQAATQPATQAAPAAQDAQPSGETGSIGGEQISSQGLKTFKQMKAELSTLTPEEQRNVLRGLIQHAKLQKKFDHPI